MGISTSYWLRIMPAMLPCGVMTGFPIPRLANMWPPFIIGTKPIPPSRNLSEFSNDPSGYPQYPKYPDPLPDCFDPGCSAFYFLRGSAQLHDRPLFIRDRIFYGLARRLYRSKAESGEHDRQISRPHGR